MGGGHGLAGAASELLNRWSMSWARSSVPIGSCATAIGEALSPAAVGGGCEDVLVGEAGVGGVQRLSEWRRRILSTNERLGMQRESAMRT